MEEITQRFILFYNFLLRNKIIKNASDFAKKMDMSASLMTELIKGRSNLGVKPIQKAITLYGLNPYWLFSKEGEMLTSSMEYELEGEKGEGQHQLNEVSGQYILSRPQKPVPLVDEDIIADFGRKEFEIDWQAVHALYFMPDFKQADFMIAVKGDAMQPKYKSGDIVICQILMNSKFIEWNKPHLLATAEHGMIIRRLHKSVQPDCVQAVAEHPDYGAFDIPKEEIKGIAIITGVLCFE